MAVAYFLSISSGPSTPSALYKRGHPPPGQYHIATGPPHESRDVLVLQHPSLHPDRRVGKVDDSQMYHHCAGRGRGQIWRQKHLHYTLFLSTICESKSRRNNVHIYMTWTAGNMRRLIILTRISSIDFTSMTSENGLRNRPLCFSLKWGQNELRSECVPSFLFQPIARSFFAYFTGENVFSHGYDSCHGGVFDISV